MDKPYGSLKKEALRLRKRGFSYGEIRDKIGISKSTLSFWLKNIALRPEHRKRLYTKQVEILSRGPRSQRERRIQEVSEIINAAKKEIGAPLSAQTLMLMGAAIYWGEGTKGGLAQITNSDPYLIAFMTVWIEKMFGIPPKNLKARLNIYPQQEERSIKKFWSRITGIPFANFGKSYVKPLSSGYKKNNLYYGTIKIEIPKSVNMRHRIFGWIQATLESFVPAIDSAERRWGSLKKVVRPVNVRK